MLGSLALLEAGRSDLLGFGGYLLLLLKTLVDNVVLKN